MSFVTFVVSSPWLFLEATPLVLPVELSVSVAQVAVGLLILAGGVWFLLFTGLTLVCENIAGKTEYEALQEQSQDKYNDPYAAMILDDDNSN